ncbi:MAG: hypothetical protein Q4G33_09590 [bacterium]|nr:hypothetical protein [bacterium]
MDFSKRKTAQVIFFFLTGQNGLCFLYKSLLTFFAFCPADGQARSPPSFQLSRIHKKVYLKGRFFMRKILKNIPVYFSNVLFLTIYISEREKRSRKTHQLFE